MKNPVKVRSSGLVFEQATIDLWLNTRGAVCPITNTYLDRSDLLADDELRNRYVCVIYIRIYVSIDVCMFACMYLCVCVCLCAVEYSSVVHNCYYSLYLRS